MLKSGQTEDIDLNEERLKIVTDQSVEEEETPEPVNLTVN